VSTRRDALSDAAKGPMSNAGLWLDVFLRDQEREDRQALIQGAIGCTATAAHVYKEAFARWELSLAEDHVSSRLRTKDWLVVGLGSKGVLESGLHLSYTYGVPAIPGSAIKGVCASYCREVWGKSDAAFTADGPFYRQVFGALDWAGALVFEDAWITPESVPKCLAKDVMTPHHQQYYGAKGRVPHPTGTDNPVPVNFLRVRGSFLFAIGWRVAGETGQGWAELAMRLCQEVLAVQGIGGKTRSGYGRMVV
jgi:CRISPR-associated protein Cmr6